MTVMSLSRDLKDDVHSDTVLSILNEQRIRGILCDVTIIVEDTKFKAHSNVLAASSLYFKNIFWSHTICISSHVLELDDLKAEVFTEILNYIYSSTVVVRTQETVTDLAAAGRKLGIAFLEDLTDRSFASSPSPYVFCITEKGTVKEEKNERRQEEPAATNGPRITNAFSIIETENSNSMFSPLDLRASFKKMSDSMRTASLCLERTDVCHEAEPVRTLAEHSYAVSSIPEPYRSQPAREQDRSSPDRVGRENGEAPATQPNACPKPKKLSIPQDSDSTPENLAAPPVTSPQADRERSPQPATALPRAKTPDKEDVPPSCEDAAAAADGAGPPAAEVPPLIYSCSCCSQSFDSSTLLSAHMQLHRPTREPPVCRYCNKQFTTLNRLDRHEHICMRSGQLPAAGEDPGFLEKYPTIGQNGGSFAGPETLLPQRRTGELAGAGGALPDADHMVKFVNGQMLYSCVVCKRSYVTLSSLRRHANVHSWRRTYPCHYCNKVFALAEYRTRHEIWHTGERRYQCIFCLETFMTYYILKNHQKSFHAIDHRLSINKKTANGGLKPTVYPYKLYRLLPMKCKRAPLKSFRDAAPRPHACELCAKQFQSPSTLRMHMRCHTGEKPYPCPTCGRRFSMQGNLQKHARIHLGLKEFVCRFCGKAFTLNETLKIHERIHTGEKRYHCQFCLQGFLYLSTKRNHERRHVREHGGKGFACFQCPKICKTAAALGMHQKKHLFKGAAKPEKAGDPGGAEASPPASPSERRGKPGPGAGDRGRQAGDRGPGGGRPGERAQFSLI
ncbi:PREDICTED: zinc finger and BTB domain-containing protein 38 [Dipodomys ordii]|uniref:Zinc finger and BTB domain-containing protein 38 n=1 Tax=Dipodomys ordii TaxID=10020 RepID=A0A1S3G9H4_DIPOR|nr:PREDICTED: zinc finger and BTB domain-containing protein 38 [Dipodomys ordii]